MATRLDELMKAHLATPFPEAIEKGTDYGEIDPVLIGADIYGWESHVSHGSRLGDVNRSRLEAAREELARSLETLPDKARPYYEQILELAAETLTEDRTRRR